MSYEPMPGMTIEEAAVDMVFRANCDATTVKAKFNDITLVATPDSNSQEIVDGYRAECNRRHEEYVNSPEYKKAQRKRERAKQRKDLLLKVTLATAPKMTLRDEEAWQKTVVANTDSYGVGVISFAERWARLMEARILNGDTLEKCAEKTSHLADNEGITGFMYGCAVSILSQAWLHGERLRHWHNLKTQIKDEGERANAEGGTLNPALLSISCLDAEQAAMFGEPSPA